MQASIRSTLFLLGTLLCVLVVGCDVPQSTLIGEWSFDQTDIRKVVGVSSHIFVGRVVAVVGNEGVPTSGPGNNSIPQTQFSVEVLENVKGELAGTVIVSQAGGRNHLGTFVEFEGDTLLEVDKTYLLATWYESENNWYSIVAQRYGHVVVDDAEKRSARGREIPIGHRTPNPSFIT